MSDEGRDLAAEYKPGVMGEARRTGAEIGQAREGLDYRLNISLEQGVTLQLDAERARRGPDAAA